ncbi:MAG: glycosyltransferase family 2 protein [Bacteroidales bacterium]|nr:glycosyltransferase family 2 protein [Bacteroidales bacterium]
MDTAIVILNWNGLHFLKRFLPVLEDCTPKENFFLVVADNGSIDGSVEWLKAEHPDVQLIEFDRNYGFTEGYNRAFREIEADYYILLNSDVEVTPGWAETLINFMEDNPDAGICQPKILSESARDTFEYAGACGGFIDHFGYPFCRGRILSNIEKDHGQYDEEEEIFWATGACMVVRSSLYHHLGGLDDLFFAHMEEIDFCWRAKLLGFQVWAVPQAKVYHVGGGTLPNNAPQKLYYNYRNNLLMLYKNLPGNVRWSIITTRKFLDFCSAMVYLVTFRWDSFKAVFRAHRDYRRLKKVEDHSVFSEEFNDIGHLRGSILLKFFLSGKKLTFDQLRFK